MAAKSLIGMNWNEIAAQVTTAKRSTGMVDIIREAAKEIMADGKAVEVRKLQQMIEIAMNMDVEEDEDKTKVNWITVKYALVNADGFKEVSKNTFVYDPSVKKAAKKSGKKQ